MKADMQKVADVAVSYGGVPITFDRDNGIFGFLHQGICYSSDSLNEVIIRLDLLIKDPNTPKGTCTEGWFLDDAGGEINIRLCRILGWASDREHLKIKERIGNRWTPAEALPQQLFPTTFENNLLASKISTLNVTLSELEKVKKAALKDRTTRCAELTPFKEPLVKSIKGRKGR